MGVIPPVHRSLRGAGCVVAVLLVLLAASSGVDAAPTTVDAAPSPSGGHDAHHHAADAGDRGFWADFFKIYTPRQACMFYESAVIWLHAVSDAVIAVAYYSIPLALIRLVRRRRDLAFGWVFWLFAAFILACGTTHLIGVVDLWAPMYRLDGVVKAATAVVSIVTAVVLWPLIPRAVALPSPSQLEATVRQRTGELAAANERLRREIAARAEAERSQVRLAAIVQSCDDAIIGETLDSTITSWNPAAERMFGYSADEAIGQSIRIIQPPDRQHEETLIIDRLRRGEPVEHFETVRCDRNGRTFDVSVTASPIFDPATGALVGISKIARDITDRKRAEQERERLLQREQAARAQAEHAGRLKDEFLATLSHELRTPLTAILGWAQILDRSLHDGDRPAPGDAPGAAGGRAEARSARLHEGLAVIHRNARAQARLVDDLLDMNRIVSGKLRLELRAVRLDDVVEAAILSIAPAAAARRVRIERLSPPGRSPVIWGDATRLQQVAWNLLTNAVKFSPEGGCVRVVVDAAPTGEGVGPGGAARLVVSDEGVGIDPAFLPRVFDRFSQSDASTTRRYGGLGLGLAIVKHLVELHGRQITLHSDGLGKGATATVLIPARSPGDRPSALAAPNPAAPRDAATPAVGDLAVLHDLPVLVIDDDPDARGLIQRLLSDRGARPILAGSADEGLGLIDTERPAVVVCDIGMPGADGYAFARALRARPPEAGGRTPAVALTAFATPDDRHRALEAGFTFHLPKPIDAYELLTTIATAAGGQP